MSKQYILLDFFEDYIENYEVDEDDELLREYNEAIKKIKSERIKRELEKLKETYKEQSMYNACEFLWEDQLDFIDDKTKQYSEHITYADYGLWDGHRIYDSETENRYTLKEAIQNMNCDDIRIYIESGEVYIEGIHHDGRNIYRWGHKMGAKIKKALEK